MPGKKRMNSVTQPSPCLLLLRLFSLYSHWSAGHSSAVSCDFFTGRGMSDLQLLHLGIAQSCRHPGRGHVGICHTYLLSFCFSFQTSGSSNSRFFCLSLLRNCLDYKFLFPLCIKEEQKVEIFRDLSSSGAVIEMSGIRRTVSVGTDRRRCHVRLETGE